MELKFYGANCLKISTKKASLVIDDTLKSQGKKSITSDKDISIITNKESDVTRSEYFNIDSAGEYELSEVSIKGIPAKLHYDPEKTTNLYSIHANGFSIAVLGHVDANLSDEQIENLGVVDLLVIPVGGSGYTIDSVEALKLIKTIEPKIVIPTHYESSNIKYEVPQLSIDELLKAAGSLEVEKLDNLKLKDNNLTEKTKIVVLQEQ